MAEITQKDRDIYGSHAHAVVAYKERIREAICGPEDSPHVWDKPAAALLYAWKKGSGTDGEGSTGYAALSDAEKQYHRNAAFWFADWIAEQLGETVMEAARENFQDDERRFLDVSKRKEMEEGPEKPSKPELPQVINGFKFLKALEEAGIIANAGWTSSLTITVDNLRDVIKIRHELIADDRLIPATKTISPSDDDIQAYLDANPEKLNGALKRYLRINGLTGVRRESR